MPTFSAFLATPTDAANKMTRKFTHKVKRNFCVEIQWLGRTQKNLESTLLKNKTEIGNQKLTFKIKFPQSYLRIDYGILEAGEYELTLHNITFPVARIDLCPGIKLNFYPARIWKILLCAGEHIGKTWLAPLKTLNCQMSVGEKKEGSTLSSASTIDLRIRRKEPIQLFDSKIFAWIFAATWSQDEWKYVCERLGANETENVRIKLCNFYGCSFDRCPHVENDPTRLSTLFANFTEQ
jgi:hypothetical protein